MTLFENLEAKPIKQNWELQQRVINGITQIAYLQHREPEDLANEILFEFVKENNRKNCQDFDWFWTTYDKSRGKEKARNLWNRLGAKQKEMIYDHLPKYVASTPDKQYRADPATYLNGKKWLDEIIIKKEKPEFPDTFDHKTWRSLQGDKSTRYKDHLESRGYKFGGSASGYWCKPPNSERIWF